MREYLNNDFLTSSFSLQEQAAIANSVKENVAESDGDVCDIQPQRWTALSGDKIFLLDAREVRNESYGYSDEQWGGDNRKNFAYKDKKTGVGGCVPKKNILRYQKMMVCVQVLYQEG